jgi:hypothetical protein
VTQYPTPVLVLVVGIILIAIGQNGVCGGFNLIFPLEDWSQEGSGSTGYARSDR